MVRTEIEVKIEEYDLDIVVSYTGRVREDTAFNIFHEDTIKIGSVMVDVNPLNIEKLVELSEYLARVEEYLSE